MTALTLLLKVTVTLVVALVGARLARGSRASVRHLVLATAFAVLLAMPVAALIVPAVRIEIPVAERNAAMLSVIDPTTFAHPPVQSTDAASGIFASATAAASASWSTPWRLAVVWMGGAALSVAPAFIGLVLIRGLRRSAQRWPAGQSMVDALAVECGVRRPVTLLLHERVHGPMTCGVRQPSIVLPVTARAWTVGDLQRAVVHELEHVRRCDWLSQSVARVVCAAYWFHPLVWIANRHLGLEAERACDDAVLRRSEALAYADQLISLAERVSGARHRAALAMASRADLATRVRALLDVHQPRGRPGALWIGFAGLTTMALVLMISPLRLVATATQATSAETFDVVSIKRCATEPLPQTGPGGRGAGPASASVSPGRAYWACVTADQLIQTAYGGPETRLLNSLSRQRAGDPQIVRSGPSWVYSDKFEIEATAAGNVAPRTMTGPMLRALLEDRFALKTHRAREERSMYQLTVAKSGLKITPTRPEDCGVTDPGAQQAPSPDAGDRPACGNVRMGWNGGNRTLTATGILLQSFTDGLLSGSILDRFVINSTGLEGRYNIPLEFAPDDNTPGGMAGLAWSRQQTATAATAPTIFKALEQLGLKVEPIRAPAEYLVIDRIERPKTNQF